MAAAIAAGYDIELPVMTVVASVIGLLVATRLVLGARSLQQHALTDGLTGLANREVVNGELERYAQAPGSAPMRGALLYIDLDGFKKVNDTLGHAAGDAALDIVALRLTKAARRGDTVARLGGDEFALLCHDVASSSDIERLAERIISAVSIPLSIDGQQVSIGASIGVVPLDHSNVGHALRIADQAMYEAKTSGGGRWQMLAREPDESAGVGREILTIN